MLTWVVGGANSISGLKNHFRARLIAFQTLEKLQNPKNLIIPIKGVATALPNTDVLLKKLLIMKISKCQPFHPFRLAYLVHTLILASKPYPPILPFKHFLGKFL